MLVLLDRDQLEEVLARRRARGADKFDEVWEGVPHLGQQVGRHASLQQQLALLLGGAAEERGLVASLAAARINEVVLVNLEARTVRWLALADGEYRPAEASRVIDLRPAALTESVIWPSEPDG